MILGIGSDMTDIRRIEGSLTRFGARFEDRCFTDHEKARARRKPQQTANTYAKRFAAKEACAKALGTGLRRGVFWSDMGVFNKPSGQPTMVLTGGALARLMQMVPKGYLPDIHLSLSDEPPYALAFVVIAARPHSDQ